MASPYAKEIFSSIFEYKNIKKTGDETVKLERTITLPNLVGLSLSEACSILSNLELTYEIQGSGGFVANQLPPAGTLCYKGESIYLISDG